MIKSLSDAVWLLSFLVAFVIANTIERINFYKELASENKKLIKRIEALVSKAGY